MARVGEALQLAGVCMAKFERTSRANQAAPPHSRSTPKHAEAFLCLPPWITPCSGREIHAICAL
jgi:hypothetical protein